MCKDKHHHNHEATCKASKAQTDSCCSSGSSKVVIESCCSHNHSHSESVTWKSYLNIGITSVLLIIGLILQKTTLVENLPDYFFKIIFGLAYLPVGIPVLKEAWGAMVNEKDFFNEFSLMGIATIGAFAIGEYPEAVAVMLFYGIGEYFQSKAVNKATQNIQSLLDVQVDEARVITDSGVVTVPSHSVEIGQHIQVRVGDKLPVDGILLSDKASFNTVALTGESVPQTMRKGDKILAGMINTEAVIEYEATKRYEDSALSHILNMVQDATERKAKTELLIRKFARWYTPFVFAIAVLVAFLPYFIVADYQFSEWLYRALIFLVISCPCALVISIPLGYFGGIGAASRKGILFKGANYLDIMTTVNTVVLDKTGTMTEGVFEVQEVLVEDGKKEELLKITSAVETLSSHPIAQAILKYNAADSAVVASLEDVEEIAGHGLRCRIGGEEILVGNHKLLDKFAVDYDQKITKIVGTTVLTAKSGKYLGVFHISDRIKSDAADAVKQLHASGVKDIIMLSGDNDAITQEVGGKIGVDKAVGGLLPGEKLAYVEELKKDTQRVICFVGDGINDAPSLALSDVGIAMGAMGSDAAIEIADVVIQTDQPSKIAQAIKIAKATRQIVFQNIALAFGVKLLVMLLGVFDVATMWEAVIADVGVTILAVLNAIRILYNKKI